MKKYILLTIILVIISYFSLTNDYMTFKEYDVVLLDKVSVSGNKYGRLYGVFKLKDDYTFDREISPTGYSQMEIGKTYSLSLRPYDIKQTSSENFFYFFMPVVIGSITLTNIIILIFSYFNNRENEK